ncbi:hypothetical protein GCM10023321_48320 [Pseudonocardia eucalypti]|uniref:Uncharacterized protein n=1 Tax=Pseudonocardia eucalypti TaxID=648755 RepID=A0ABP9QIN2_9PSEU
MVEVQTIDRQVATARRLRHFDLTSASGDARIIDGRLLTPGSGSGRVKSTFRDGTFNHATVARAPREIDGPTGDPGEIIRARITEGASV